jgi:hypothetical protein
LPVSSTSWEFHSGNSAAIPINCDKADDGFRFRLRRLSYARIGQLPPVNYIRGRPTTNCVFA